jgi:hypothetical protein
MPFFIAYSDKDETFVDRLAAQLAFRRRHVWVDRWELKVGDSILNRIQEALTEAPGLIIVFSKSSVRSAWCQKELSSGLMRELEEKRVVVLPALLENCEIPSPLRNKMHADFRASFDAGFNELLHATESVSSDALGRKSDDEFYHDWAINWAADPLTVALDITACSSYKKHPFSILTRIKICGKEDAARKFIAYEKAGLRHIGQAVILTSCAEVIDAGELQLLICDDGMAVKEFAVGDTKSPLRYTVSVRCRRLGKNTGNDIRYDVGAILWLVRDTLLRHTRMPNAHEILAVGKVPLP